MSRQILWMVCESNTRWRWAGGISGRAEAAEAARVEPSDLADHLREGAAGRRLGRCCQSTRRDVEQRVEQRGRAFVETAFCVTTFEMKTTRPPQTSSATARNVRVISA